MEWAQWVVSDVSVRSVLGELITKNAALFRLDTGPDVARRHVFAIARRHTALRSPPLNATD